MTQNDLLVAVAAVLTTALETEPSPFPESLGYIAIGGDMTKWGYVKCALLRGALATFSGNSIRLTDSGRELARQCDAVLPQRTRV